MKVFLMWSGERSRRVATKLREFLEVVVQRPEYFVSTDNIQPGAVWENIIAGELETTHFGIACLEKESLKSLWIQFESGAISKSTAKSIVVPYLIDLSPSEITGPLTKFQSIPANEEGTLSLAESINNSLQTSDRISAKALRTAFEGLWPDLEKVIAEPPPSKEIEEKPRSIEDILREVLIRLRSVEKQIGVVSSTAVDSHAQSQQLENKYMEAAQRYAVKKAEISGWSRPGMYFEEEELAANTIVPRELTYFALDSLRALGLVTCVNWKGESTWMLSEKAKNIAKANPE